MHNKNAVCDVSMVLSLFLGGLIVGMYMFLKDLVCVSAKFSKSAVMTVGFSVKHQMYTVTGEHDFYY